MLPSCLWGFYWALLSGSMRGQTGSKKQVIFCRLFCQPLQPEWRSSTRTARARCSSESQQALLWVSPSVSNVRFKRHGPTAAATPSLRGTLRFPSPLQNSFANDTGGNMAYPLTWLQPLLAGAGLSRESTIQGTWWRAQPSGWAAATFSQNHIRVGGFRRNSTASITAWGWATPGRGRYMPPIEDEVCLKYAWNVFRNGNSGSQRADFPKC